MRVMREGMREGLMREGSMREGSMLEGLMRVSINTDGEPLPKAVHTRDLKDRRPPLLHRGRVPGREWVGER